MSRDVALGTADVWDGLRLVVLDVETTVGPDRGRLRAVSLGVATVRAARITGQWHRLIDPDTPIDAASQRIHHLTDELVAGEPTFDQIADELLALLEPRGGETVWVAAHNARFDVSVLRHELKRFGRDLPDIPVIDTMGPLVSVAGLSVKQPSLATLAAELSLTRRCGPAWSTGRTPASTRPPMRSPSSAGRLAAATHVSPTPTPAASQPLETRPR